MLRGRRAQIWRHQPAYRRPRHFHEEPELNLVLAGRATFGVGDRVVEAERGTVLLFQPAQDHVLLQASADLDLFVVALAPELAGRATGSLTRACAQGCRLAESETEHAHEALQALSGVASALDTETLLATLFASVTARCEQPHVLSRLTLEHVNADLEASGERLAHLLRTDPSALSRHFHDDLNVRFVEYRARLRLMSFVKRADLGATLSQAAALAGFGSYAQCHRVFTRMLGCAPRQYFRGQRGEIDARLHEAVLRGP
jgi:AraC-like DNA-binding protein